MVTHPVRRALASAVVTLALVAVLLLVPDAVRVYASNMIGALRTPGEAAFVAGHRGDRAAAPENTMPSFQAAIASDLDFLETDVQLTSDGYPVLMHDETVDRTTNGTGAVAELTFAQIRALDAGSWYAPKFAGTQVPSLDEFLDALASSRKKALVELKGLWTADQVRSILDDIFVRGVQNRIVFASFELPTVASLAEAAPAIPRIVNISRLPKDPVELLRRYDAIGVVTTPGSIERDPTAISRLHAAGLGVIIYTLNSTSRWNEAIGEGVDGIVSDKPTKLDRWIAKTAATG